MHEHTALDRRSSRDFVSITCATCVSRVPPCCDMADCQLRPSDSHEWKMDDEMCITRLRLHRYLAVMSIDNDPAHDIESESGAFARLFGGKERIEDPRGQVRRNTWALISDVHD